MSLMQMSGSASLLILVTLLLRRLTGERLPRRTFVVLWEVAVLRLLVPLSIPSGLSVYSLLREKTAAAQNMTSAVLPVMSQQAAENAAPPKVLEGVTLVPATAPAAVTRSAVSLLPIVWGVGAVLLAAVFLAAYVRGYCRFRSAVPDQREAVQAWKQAHPLRRGYDIRICSGIASPMTYGVLRPVILLPEGAVDWDERALNCILTHEWMHIRHIDAGWKLLLTAAVCLHWCNPLVWVLYFRMNRELELACDEGVLKHLNGDCRREYALTLLSMEERRSGLMPLTSGFSKSAIEERVKSIMKSRRPGRAVVLAGVVVVLAVLCLFGTGAKRRFADVIPADGAITLCYTDLEGYLAGGEKATMERYQTRYTFYTDSEEGRQVRMLLEQYSYGPGLCTLRGLVTGGDVHNAAGPQLTINATGRTSWGQIVCYGDGTAAVWSGNPDSSGTYHVGGFGKGESQQMIDEIWTYLQTCQPEQWGAEQTLEQMAGAFLEEVYATNRNGRYDRLQAAGDSIDSMEAAMNSYMNELYYLTTDDLFQNLNANRIPYKYDKLYEADPQTVTGVALEAREAEGDWYYTVRTTAASGIRRAFTGTIRVESETGLVSGFHELTMAEEPLS